MSLYFHSLSTFSQQYSYCIALSNDSGINNATRVIHKCTLFLKGNEIRKSVSGSWDVTPPTNRGFAFVSSACTHVAQLLKIGRFSLSKMQFDQGLNHRQSWVPHAGPPCLHEWRMKDITHFCQPHPQKESSRCLGCSSKIEAEPTTLNLPAGINSSLWGFCPWLRAECRNARVSRDVCDSHWFVPFTQHGTVGNAFWQCCHHKPKDTHSSH